MTSARGAFWGLPVHLAYILGTYPQPSETFIAREIDGLRARGWAITIYSLFAPRVREAGVVYGWPGAMGRVERWVGPGRLGARWRTAIAEAGCDAVVAHFGSEPSTVALQAVGDLPLILSLHARDLYVEAEGLAEKLARAAATVTCTRANLDYLRAHFPAQASRCRLIYHGLPAAWLDAPLLPRLRPGGPLRILAVGRLVPKKGFAVLLEACARMGVAWELRVLGDGPGRRALAEDAERLRITRQVHFDGWASQDDVREGYAWADVLACPSIIAPDGDRDGLPNVVVEAMATGLPVVGSAISGIPEAVLDGDTGFLVPPGDPVALAAALTRCGDAPLRARLGEAAAARARAHFDGERWLDALAHVIQGCVASCGSESSGG